METLLLCVSLLLSAFVAYLIGSINFAIIVTRLFAKKDIRDFGSGNAGMTNVLRTLGAGPAALVTVGDFCKGLLAVLFGHLIIGYLGGGLPFFTDYMIALFVMLGHCFPVFYGFKGGKGILVSAGVILALDWRVFLIILGVFLVVVAIRRIVSLASISAAVAFPIATLVLALIDGSHYVLWDTLFAVVLSAIVIFMHRANIKRLLNGTEKPFGKKKK